MEGVGNISEIAGEIVKLAGTSSKSSAIDKEINKKINELFCNNKESIQLSNYQDIKTFKQLVRGAIKDINNPGHDLTFKRSKKN